MFRVLKCNNQSTKETYSLIKKLITILSAMLVVARIKSQKTSVQKEAVKPVSDMALKASVSTIKMQPHNAPGLG